MLLYEGIKLHIENVIYSSMSQNFKDIIIKGYHIEIRNEEDIEYLYITRHILDKISAVKRLHVFSFE